MSLTYYLLVLVLACCVLLTIKTGKLTTAAAITGGLICLLIFLGAGYFGVAMMAAFFIMATIATSWRIDEKAGRNLAEKNKGRRTTGQVIANGGVAGILGLLAWLYPASSNIFILMIAAGFSSATADTLSSELGNIYGSRYYNILTFKKDTRGLNGVISIEGTLIGLAGSLVISIIYAIGFRWNINIITIIVAGTIGNLSDSILGATLERSKYINNNGVNFLNTCIAALVAYLISMFN